MIVLSVGAARRGEASVKILKGRVEQMIDLIRFPRSYKVENKTKRYADPVSDHDINLLEQMGATVIKDEAKRTITILNDPFKRFKRRCRERRTL